MWRWSLLMTQRRRFPGCHSFQASTNATSRNGSSRAKASSRALLALGTDKRWSAPGTAASEVPLGPPVGPSQGSSFISTMAAHDSPTRALESVAKEDELFGTQWR